VAQCIADPNPRWAPAADSDTGWRNLSGSLVNGWAVTNSLYGPHIRRIGNQVRVISATYLGLDGTSATEDNFVELPSGFLNTKRHTYGSNVGFFSVYASVPATIYGVSCPATTGRFLRVPPGNKYAGELTWITDEAWPTTLPGTPA